MSPSRRVVFIQRRPGGSGRGLRCALALARARKARLVVVEGEPRAEGLLPGALTFRVGQSITSGPSERMRRYPAGGHLDLLVKVAEPAATAMPWRLRPVDRLFLRSGPRPFWLLHPAQGDSLRVVLAAVGLDGRLGAEDAAVLRAAHTLSRSLRGELHVVRPWSWFGESILWSPTRGLSPARRRSLGRKVQAEHEAELARFVAESLPRSPASVVVRKGDPLSVLRQTAWNVEADVVVTTGRGPEGLHGWILGAFGERLALALPSSLMLVDGRGWDDAAEVSPTSKALPRPLDAPAGAPT